MVKIYEHENYYLKMNRVYPKTGLPILNKHTNEAVFSLYNASNDKFLYLKDTHIVKKNIMNDDAAYSKETITPEEFQHILIAARKYALDTNKSLLVSGTLAKRYDIQNFVLHNTNEDDKHSVIPMSNEEIIKVNAVVNPVQVRIPRDICGNLPEFHITKARTDNDTSIILKPYIVSSGKIIFDINNPEDFKEHVYLQKKNFDFSNIVSLKNSGDNDVFSVVFPEIDGDFNDTYKMPQHVDDNFRALLGVKMELFPSEPEPNPDTIKERDFGKTVFIVPKKLLNDNKNIRISGSGKYITDSTIKLIENMHKDHYQKDSGKIKVIDSVISLYDEHPYLFERDGFNQENNMDYIKSLRDKLNVIKNNDLEM